MELTSPQLTGAQVTIVGMHYTRSGTHVDVYLQDDDEHYYHRYVVDQGTADLIASGSYTLGTCLEIDTNSDGSMLRSTPKKRINLPSDDVPAPNAPCKRPANAAPSTPVKRQANNHEEECVCKCRRAHPCTVTSTQGG